MFGARAYTTLFTRSPLASRQPLGVGDARGREHWWHKFIACTHTRFVLETRVCPSNKTPLQCIRQWHARACQPHSEPCTCTNTSLNQVVVDVVVLMFLRNKVGLWVWSWLLMVTLQKLQSSVRIYRCVRINLLFLLFELHLMYRLKK